MSRFVANRFLCKVLETSGEQQEKSECGGGGKKQFICCRKCESVYHQRCTTLSLQSAAFSPFF